MKIAILYGLSNPGKTRLKSEEYWLVWNGVDRVYVRMQVIKMPYKDIHQCLELALCKAKPRANEVVLNTMAL